MVTETILLTNLYPESSAALERFNICGRKGEQKERAKGDRL